jgi:chaperonin cofactor prefoldin
VSDGTIHEQIADLVSREHQLREQLQSGAISAAEEHQQLQDVETALDQCWDLLRQRDALRAVGRSPDGAAARPVDQVENYQN